MKKLDKHLQEKIKEIEGELEHVSPNCCLGCEKRSDALKTSLEFYYSQL